MTSPDDRTQPSPQPSPSPYATGGYIPGPSSPLPPSEHLLLGPPPAPKKSRAWRGIIALAALIVAVVGVVLAVQSGSGPNTSGNSGNTPAPKLPAVAQPAEPVTDEATTAPPVEVEPKASDVHLKLQVTDKECFGSAGCNVTVKVKMTYSGPGLDPDGTWLVTYEVKGGDDGPIIGSFQMMGDRTYEVNSELISTPSSKTKTSVKVTNLEKVGI